MICSIVMYSNAEYSDVWKVFNGQHKKFFPDNPFKQYLLTDEVISDDMDGWEPILYSNDDGYRERLIHCIEKIDEPSLILCHEDMFLYDSVDLQLLKDYTHIVNNHDIDFIRLILSGVKKLKKSIYDLPLWEINFSDRDTIFAIQPTVWKKDVLLDILRSTNSTKVGIYGPAQIEVEASRTAESLNIRGLVHYDNEKARGGHYDSNVYPYIATAIRKGRWNMSEYPNELGDILTEYGIDWNIRGII